MIANYIAEGWEIITQRSHAMLAAQICGQWKISDQPPRWVETLVAVAEHDDVFNELERGPLVNSKGGPIDFKMTSFDPEASQRLMDMAVSKSSYVALLTAKHIEFTHGKEPKAAEFIIGLKRQMKIWMESTDITQKDLIAAYDLLEFCDAFSLLICQNLIPPQKRSLEISSGPGKKAYSFAEIGKKLIVKPWPFEAGSFVINYESRTLKSLTFSSDAALRKELLQAPILLKTVRLSNV